jgi:hypothetical protein
MRWLLLWLCWSVTLSNRCSSCQRHPIVSREHAVVQLQYDFSITGALGCDFARFFSLFFSFVFCFC